MLLTHDYSVTTAVASIGKRIERHEGELYFSEEIIIGDNCFIGARASLLPGTILEDNVIIGSGAVVKGYIPNNSILIGNPARVIKNTEKWAREQLTKGDYYVE